MKYKSAKGLDLFNFAAADIRDGLGPYLTLFLIAKGWSASSIGIALSAASFSSLLVTPVSGYILDRVSRKKPPLVYAALTIAVGVFGIWSTQDFWTVIIFQLLIGVASAFVGPGIALISRLVGGADGLSKRIGRNEVFNHAGNFAAASISAWLVNVYSLDLVFALVVFMSIICALSLVGINTIDLAKEIPDDTTPSSANPRALIRLIRSSKLFSILLLAALFQIANASLLPIMAQVRQSSFQDGTPFVSSGVIIAQLSSIPFCWLAARLSKNRGAEFPLGVGFVAIALRSLIFLTCTNLKILELAQVLDGLAAGTIAVVPILALFKSSPHTRHFGLLSGILAAFISIGACISTFSSGFIMQYSGANVYFAAVIAIACVGLTAVLRLHRGLRFQKLKP